ncbi:MAG TPA: outer membrane beta-barrel protein [Xanthobacteraceae bacterium]|jgi:outer membrane immunogenic protein
MKKLLLNSAAFGVFALGFAVNAVAADLPARAPMYNAPAPSWSWTGFYIGGHVGGGWGDKHWHSPAFTPSIDQGMHHVRGGLGGGQVGFNVQLANWVVGIEADASWAALNGSNADNFFVVNGSSEVNRSKVDSVGTVAGRLGYAVDRVLGYVKGGGAWVRDEYSVSNIVAPGTVLATASENRWGWMAGIGLEYAFAPNWSVKFEYDYLDFGTKRLQFTGPNFVPFNEDIDQHLSLFKVGINYRFGSSGPVYAKY